MSCICQICGNKYKSDVIISNLIWEKIKTNGKLKGAGLICGRCIFDRIENLNEYSSFELKISK